MRPLQGAEEEDDRFPCEALQQMLLALQRPGLDDNCTEIEGQPHPAIRDTPLDIVISG